MRTSTPTTGGRSFPPSSGPPIRQARTGLIEPCASSVSELALCCRMHSWELPMLQSSTYLLSNPVHDCKLLMKTTSKARMKESQRGYCDMCSGLCRWTASSRQPWMPSTRCSGCRPAAKRGSRAWWRGAPTGASAGSAHGAFPSLFSTTLTQVLPRNEIPSFDPTGSRSHRLTFNNPPVGLHWSVLSMLSFYSQGRIDPATWHHGHCCCQLGADGLSNAMYNTQQRS